MSKLFTFAGTVTENGATVYKFANDAKRAKALERFGCTDVNLVELPNAMDKEAAVAYLATKGVTAAKAPRVAKTAKVAKSATVKVKATKGTKIVATKGGDEALKERGYALGETDDAPIAADELSRSPSF